MFPGNTVEQTGLLKIWRLTRIFVPFAIKMTKLENVPTYSSFRGRLNRYQDRRITTVVSFVFYFIYRVRWPVNSFLCFLILLKHDIIVPFYIHQGTTELIVTNKMYQHQWSIEHQILLSLIIANYSSKSNLKIPPVCLNLFLEVLRHPKETFFKTLFYPFFFFQDCC